MGEIIPSFGHLYITLKLRNGCLEWIITVLLFMTQSHIPKDESS